jgi:hypothetical protein
VRSSRTYARAEVELATCSRVDRPQRRRRASTSDLKIKIPAVFILFALASDPEQRPSQNRGRAVLNLAVRDSSLPTAILPVRGSNCPVFRRNIDRANSSLESRLQGMKSKCKTACEP